MNVLRFRLDIEHSSRIFAPFGVSTKAGDLQSSFDAHDEDIALQPGGWHRFWQLWARDFSSLGLHEMTGSIAQVALEEGFTAEQICQLFANHAVPDSSGAQSCHDLLLHEGDIRAAAVPPGPFGLAVHRDPTTPTTVTFTFRDASPEATGFLITVTDASGRGMNMPIAYARSVSFDQRGLTPDTRYTVSVHTLNQTTMSTRSADASFVTFSEPVPSAAVTNLPGGAQITWTLPATTPVDGTRVRMTAPFVRAITDAPITVTSALVTGLSSAASFDFMLATLNSAGEESVPVMVTAHPLAPTELFVAPWGADIAGAGTQTLPFRTLGAAIAAASSSGATGQVIRVAVGSYPEPTSPSIGTDLAIIGGYMATATSWPAMATGTSTISLSSLTTGLTAVSAPDFNEAGHATDAAIAVRAGTTVSISGLDLRLSRSITTTNCAAVVDATDANLTLEHVTLGASIPVNDRSCAALLIAGGSGTVSLVQTTVEGFDFGTGLIPHADLAGVVVATSELSIDGSTVIGLARALGGGPNLVGTVASGVRSVRITGSTIDAWTGSHALSGGFAAGLHAVDVRTLSVDDTLIRTPSGALVNRAVLIETPTAHTRTTIVHSVLAAGDDALLATPLVASHHGAAIAVTGAPGAVQVVNSIMSTATGGGATPDANTVLAVMDLSLMTRAASDITIEGNAWSMPTFLGRFRDASTALMFCRPAPNHELANGEGEGLLNDVIIYACGMSLTSIDMTRWVASGNIALTVVVPSTLDPCTAITACTGATTCVGGLCPMTTDLEFVAALTSNGRPTHAPSTPDSAFRVAEAGVPLSTLPFVLPTLTDFGGTMRCTTAAQGAGAWILTTDPCP